ncbi:unnamed protein product, partial [Closterium sp. NIES-54]
MVHVCLVFVYLCCHLTSPGASPVDWLPQHMHVCVVFVYLCCHQVHRQLTVPGFDPSLFEAQQVFVPSTDCTRIPMFVVCRKGLPRTSDHFTLLYGYGGFNICIKPSFSVARVLLMRHHGAVVAVANIRGGGEYGERWHKEGALAHKQQCFDDFY